MNFEQNGAGHRNVKTMLAANGILAGGVDSGLFVEVGFASDREDPLRCAIGAGAGVDMNGDGFRAALLTGPASDVRPGGVNGNAVDVADNGAYARGLSHGLRAGERCQAQSCDTGKIPARSARVRGLVRDMWGIQERREVFRHCEFALALLQTLPSWILPVLPVCYRRVLRKDFISRSTSASFDKYT